MPEIQDSLDMELIAELVRRAGFVAYVEQTGGGCATIYASRTANERGYPTFVGEPGEEHCEAIAGPGWFEGPDWTQPRGSRSDFAVGWDDQGETEPYYAAPADDEASLARVMIETMTGERQYTVRPPHRPCLKCGHGAPEHSSFGGYTPNGQFTAGCTGADGCTCSYAQYQAPIPGTP